MVAKLTASLMSDQTEQAMEAIMGKYWRQEWVASADWAADQSRRPGKTWMRKMHYTWFEVGDQAFDPEKNCMENHCSVAAVLQSKMVLKGDHFSKQQKRQALKYLVHYVADLHQPTNCGFSKDESGRKILLATPDLKKVNLHWVWETGMMDKKASGWNTIAGQLRRDIEPESMSQWSGEMSPAQWVVECHQVSKDVAYRLANKKSWDSEYFMEAEPTYNEQLIKASVRAAAMLNEIFE